MPPATVQEVAARGAEFWSQKGCAALGPPRGDLVDSMFEPQSYFRMLGPEPWRSVQLQRVLRPEFAFLDQENFPVSSLQISVVWKGAEEQAQGLVLESLRAMGFELERRDVRFHDETRRSPILGLFGVGWRLVVDGVRLGSLSYVQRAAGQSLDPVSLAVSYEVERLALLQQRVEALPDLQWSSDLRYGDLRSAAESELADLFSVERRSESLDAEVEATVSEGFALLEREMVQAAFVKAHEAALQAYSLGAARGERVAAWHARVGALVDACSRGWLDARRRLGFPLSGDARQSGVIRRVGV